MDSKGPIDTIYLHFEKHFVKYSLSFFKVLLDKLRCFRLTINLCTLMSSYLYVPEYLKASLPSSDVPQGSNFGTVLFLIFNNNISDSLACQSLLLTNDLTKMKSHNGCQKMQRDTQIIAT